LPVTFVALHLGWRALGLVGVAAAVVFVRALDMIIIVRVVGRKLGMKARDLRYFAPLLRIAAATAIAAVGAGLARMALIKWGWMASAASDLSGFLGPALKGAEWNALLTLIGCSLVFGLVYGASAWVLGAVTETEKARVRKLLVKFRLRREQAQPIESAS
jgi:hypothetical protein